MTEPELLLPTLMMPTTEPVSFADFAMCTLAPLVSLQTRVVLTASAVLVVALGDFPENHQMPTPISAAMRSPMINQSTHVGFHDTGAGTGTAGALGAAGGAGGGVAGAAAGAGDAGFGAGAAAGGAV